MTTKPLSETIAQLTEQLRAGKLPPKDVDFVSGGR